MKQQSVIIFLYQDEVYELSVMAHESAMSIEQYIRAYLSKANSVPVTIITVTKPPASKNRIRSRLELDPHMPLGQCIEALLQEGLVAESEHA